MTEKNTDKGSVGNREAANYAAGSSLGEGSQYDADYSPTLLHPILRSDYQDTVEHFLEASYGYDLWQCYEVSWLNIVGLPQVALAKIVVPMASAAIVESKSLKLYLNSLHYSYFSSMTDVQLLIARDLSASLGVEVVVKLHCTSTQKGIQSYTNEQDGLLDKLEVACTNYQRDPELLALDANGQQVKDEWLYSHLLRSHCPVTNQPDWATLNIRYSGGAIDRKSLLRYIVSFRQHNGFHEQCVEQIYSDLMRQCRPVELTVYAQYTRRGGIDINPLRSSNSEPLLLDRVWRQ